MSLNKTYTRKIEYLSDNLAKRIYEPVLEVSFDAFFTFDRLSYEEAKQHDRKKVNPGLQWGKKWEYGWFFAQVTIPEFCDGKRVCFKAKLGECLVYINGEIYGALDNQHKEITLTKKANSGEVFEIAMEVYAGHSGLEDCLDQIHRKIIIPGENVGEFPDNINQKVIKNGSIGIYHDEVFKCLMDINTLYDLRNNLEDNSLRKEMIDKSLKDACDVIDIEYGVNDFLACIVKAREKMQQALLCNNGSTAPTVYAIGHSHLDLEWLWTKNETKRKIARTLGNQLKLIDEYNKYKYIQSQPWLLEVVKKDYPELYKKVKKAVSDGKIVIEGGMWVEADTNIPSGESLVRQFLFGKKFIKDEFGTESVMLWLPDIFGCSGSLPQIMDKCGIKYFMNAKVTWLYDGGEMFPHSNFMWKGIDGTKIQAFVTQEYTVDMTPSKMFEKWGMNNEKEDVPFIMCAFGHGDGGGGATRTHLEYIEREKDLEGMPKVICDSPIKFFEDVKNNCDIKKEYVGEIYYPAHRGSYTSQALTKKLNRKCEFALREVELWTALIEFGSYGVNKDKINEMWKVVLFNQFHDILPGTSITKVYEDAEEEFKDVINCSKEIIDKTTEKVLENKKGYITVFNSLSWDRKTFIELPAGTNAIADSDGNDLQTQTVNGKTIALVTVPSVGMRSYYIYNKSYNEKSFLKKDLVLENNKIIACFNSNGELKSIISKDTGEEFLSGNSNKIRLYKDTPLLFDAWDIDDFYEKQEIDFADEAEIVVESTGELMSSILITKKVGSSIIRQRVTLKKDESKIDFETEIEWNETHKLLKVDFNTNIKTDEFISEIQFGHIKRPNHKSRKHDADRFEVCQHKWSLLAENNRGIAILNDCKYGISAENGKMSLTLLRAPTAPAFTADKGHHKLVYSLMPFTESFYDSDVIKKAYELNSPVHVKEGYTDEKKYISISGNDVILDTVKVAENSADLILRLFESKNASTLIDVSFDFNVEKVYVTDMLENIISEIKVINNSISLQFSPFEIKTVKVIRS